MSETSWLDEWDRVVAAGNNPAIEETWLTRLEGDLDEPGELIEAMRRLRSAGKKTLAASLLELGEVESSARDHLPATKLFLRELLRLGIGDGERQRRDLEACVRRLWAGRPSLESLLEHFSLLKGGRPAETLDTLEAWLTYDLGTVVAMNGRGAGRVVEASPELGVVRVDFERDRRFPVPIDAAAKYLTPLPPGHFLRRRLEEPEEVARLVAERPSEAIEEVIAGLGGAATVSEIKGALEGLVAADEWTGWWNRARKNRRLLASGSGSKVRYRLAASAAEGGAEAEIRSEFVAAGLAAKVDLARRHGSRSRELGAWLAAGLLRAVTESRDELEVTWDAVSQAERLGAPADEVEAARRRLLAAHSPAGLLAALGDATRRQAFLEFLRGSAAEEWPAVFAAQLGRETHPRVLGYLAESLIAGGRGADVEAFLDRIFLTPERYPEAFVWACESGEDGELGRLLCERHSGALLVRLVELAGRAELAAVRGRLKCVLSAEGVAAVILQERLSLEQARRLATVLERPGEPPESRAWLRRSLLTRFPELREGGDDDAIPALASTRERLADELKGLLGREIPQVLRAIQEAREHGDLRENFEYHAARARQELLSARAAQLQADLARMRVIDPGAIDLSIVRAGARVVLERPGERRAVTILGPYEADPERDVVSNESEAAGGLLGAEVGADVTFAGERWTIAAIEAAEEEPGSA